MLFIIIIRKGPPEEGILRKHLGPIGLVMHPTSSFDDEVFTERLLFQPLVTRTTYHSAQSAMHLSAEQTHRGYRAGPYLLTCDPKAQRNAEDGDLSTDCVNETRSTNGETVMFHIQQRFMTR